MSHSLVFRIAGEANSTSSRETSHQTILNKPVNKGASFLTSSGEKALSIKLSSCLSPRQSFGSPVLSVGNPLLLIATDENIVLKALPRSAFGNNQVYLSHHVRESRLAGFKCIC